MVEPTHLKNKSEIGSFPQVEVNIKKFETTTQPIINGALDSHHIFESIPQLQDARLSTKSCWSPQWRSDPKIKSRDFGFPMGNNGYITILKWSLLVRARDGNYGAELIKKSSEITQGAKL